MHSGPQSNGSPPQAHKLLVRITHIRLLLPSPLPQVCHGPAEHITETKESRGVHCSDGHIVKRHLIKVHLVASPHSQASARCLHTAASPGCLSPSPAPCEPIQRGGEFKGMLSSATLCWPLRSPHGPVGEEGDSESRSSPDTLRTHGKQKKLKPTKNFAFNWRIAFRAKNSMLNFKYLVFDYASASKNILFSIW